MVIGFDAKRLFCNFTGLGNYSRTLLGNLARYYPEYLYHLYTPRIIHNPETRPFLQEHSFRIHLGKSPLKSLWRSYLLSGELKRDRIEIFHGLSHELPLGIKKTGVRTVVTIHDLIFKVFPETYPMIDRKIYDLKFAYACRTADRIIAISESTKNDIVKHYGIDEDKIDVVYQACNPVFYKNEDQEFNAFVKAEYQLPDEFILYVGSVEKRKNLKTLLDALKILEPSDRPALVVVGRGGKYKEECKVKAENLGLNPWILWLDRLWQNEHLQAMYQMAKVFVYPSVYEGFGLPVAEALINKTPVITSRVSSLPEAGGPSTLYIDPLSPAELAGNLKNILGNRVLQEKMKKEGYAYALKTFEAGKTTSQILDVYQQLHQSSNSHL